MPHSKPQRYTKTIQVVDPENDPPEEIIQLSDVDCMYLKVYVPITLTYKLADDVDREVIITNICEGLRQTSKEYRGLAGYIHPDPGGRFVVKRTAARGNFTIHINNLEHTDFPSYHELEKGGFPFSNLNEQHLPPSFSMMADPTTNPSEGFPVAQVQINLISGGIVIGAAIHHQCVAAKGCDAILARWAANTRALFTNIPPPAFDPSCLDPTPLDSTTPLPAGQIPEVEARIKSYAYIPVLPEQPFADEPIELAQTIFHFPPRSLAALKASASQPPDQWVSSGDSVSALMWRAATRARLPSQTIAPDAHRDETVQLRQAVDIRDHHAPPVPAAYPGNSHTIACADATLAHLLAPDAFPAVARALRRSIDAARAPRMVKDIMDYFAAFRHDLNGVRAVIFRRPRLDTVSTSWAVMGAYRTHDFGFGPLRALRCASGDFNGVVIVFPRRVNEGDPEEGLEAFVTLEKGEMERLRKDGELLRWAQVRSC